MTGFFIKLKKILKNPLEAKIDLNFVIQRKKLFKILFFSIFNIVITIFYFTLHLFFYFTVFNLFK